MTTRIVPGLPMLVDDETGAFAGVRDLNSQDVILPQFAYNADGSVAGLVGPGVSIPLFYGSNICVMGDSIAANNSSIVSGSYNTRQQGQVPWMLSYLGWPWQFEPTDNFAVSGTSLDVMLANQLPTLLAAHASRNYSRCFISAGTNDTNAARPIATIKANFTTLFQTLQANGITPVHTGIRPRGADVATTAAKQQNAAINEWLYQQSLTGLLEFIDVSATYADNSTAFGNCLAALMYDAVLHPNGRGACLEGRAMADYYKAAGVIPQMRLAMTQNDIFDRTNNPSGLTFSNANPLLQGGTTAPTGMSTAGGTWSKVNRTLPNGQVRTDCSCVLAASTLHYLYDDWIATGAWSASQLQPGDIVEARAKVIITSGVGITNISLKAVTTDGVTATAHTGLATDASSVPDGDHTLWLKSPRFTVPAYGGSGNANVYARAECQTGVGGSGTFVVQAFEMRKVG